MFPKLTQFLKDFPELKEYQDVLRVCNNADIESRVQKRKGLYEFMEKLKVSYFEQGINKEIEASVPEWGELWKM